MESEQTRSLGERYVGLAVSTATLAALALPAIGALTRIWSYTLVESIPPEAATAIPLAELAIIALSPLVGTLTAFVLVGSASIVALRLVPRFGQSPEQWDFMDNWKVRPRHLAVVVALASLLFFALVSLNLRFPSFPIFMLGTVIAALIVAKGAVRTRQMTRYVAVPAALVLALTVVCLQSLQPGGTRAVYVTPAFGNDALTEGWYDELGASADSVFLRPCDGAEATIRVAPRDIQSRQYSVTRARRPEDPTLLDWLRGEPVPPLGYLGGCDAASLTTTGSSPEASPEPSPEASEESRPSG